MFVQSHDAMWSNKWRFSKFINSSITKVRQSIKTKLTISATWNSMTIWVYLDLILITKPCRSVIIFIVFFVVLFVLIIWNLVLMFMRIKNHLAPISLIKLNGKEARKHPLNKVFVYSRLIVSAVFSLLCLVF